MITYKQLFFPLIIFLFFSCSSEHKNTQRAENDTKQNKNLSELKNETVYLQDDVFGKTIELTGKPVNLPANIEMREPQMLIKNDYLIIVTPFAGKNIFKVFSLPDFKLISKFGVAGGGPLEFNMPDIVPTDEPDKLFYTYEYPIQRLSYITGDFKLHRCKIKFPRGKLSASSLRKIHVLSDSNMLYVAMSANGKKIYHFNPDANPPETPVFDLALDEKYNNWAAYIGCFGVNKEKNRMVYAYKYFREIKFMDLKADKVKHLIFDYKKPKAGNPVEMLAPTNISYYWKIASTSENVYFSYSGRSPIQVVRDEKKGIENIYIEQYTWNAEPVHKYELDHWGYFCVDEKRNRLYLLATNSEEPFYVYDLPKK